MIPKERVAAAISQQEPDRTPINYLANADIDRRLKRHFGLQPDDGEGLLKALDVDFRGVGPRYIGQKLYEDIPDRGVKVDNWGVHRRWVEHETGGYWDYCDFPLCNADEETVANWRMPSPDDYDYSAVREQCERHRRYACVLGHAGIGDIINSSGTLRGMERTLMDLINGDPAGLLLAERRTAINVEILRRSFEAAAGGIDLLWMGEDLGTQIAPIISLRLYRKTIRPLHQRIIDVAKQFNVPVMVHTCGSSSWVYEDFIEMGVNVVDTLQPEAKNMAPAHLKNTFGGRLAFHGCISTAGPVATGTVDETIRYCEEIMDIMMPGGGYCFSPTHSLQDNSPTENVVAMYETAKRRGVYR